MLVSAGRSYASLMNICIWNKKNGGMGSFYRSKHEMICVFKNGQEPHINNIELGKHGRYRTNVWDYAGQTSLHKKRSKELAMHPTVKPVEMIKVGTRLRRLWQGKVHEITTVQDGWIYDGSKYRSLSEIARLITGTRWNGRLFFGIKSAAANAHNKLKRRAA